MAGAGDALPARPSVCFAPRTRTNSARRRMFDYVVLHGLCADVELKSGRVSSILKAFANCMTKPREQICLP